MYNSTGIFEYGQDVIINGEKVEGAVLTSMAFADAIPWFPIVLTVAIILFAISTMISWSYYGLQSWMYLFGKSKLSDLVYKLLFLVFIVIVFMLVMKKIKHIHFFNLIIFPLLYFY